jgi:hypothetical protein
VKMGDFGGLEVILGVWLCEISGCRDGDFGGLNVKRGDLEVSKR